MADYQRLSAQDRSFLELESRETHMHVGGVFIFEASSLFSDDGALDLASIQHLVCARIHKVPRYRQRLAWIPIEQHPVWVDDADFDILSHVRHVRIAAPGRDDDLKQLCSQIYSSPLDRGRPLWELWIISGLELDRVALLFKVHHCMIDGIAGMELLQVLLSLEPEKELEPAPTWSHRPAPSGAQLFGDAMMRRARLSLDLGSALLRASQRPAEAARSLADSILGVAEIGAAGLWSASPSLFNQPIGPDRGFDWVGFDLETIKDIRRRLGGTLNDVVLAVVSGAVGKFLERQGVSHRERARFDFRAYCPVNLRSASDQTVLGNRVSAMIIPLPIAVGDPRECLREVTRTTLRLKASRQAMGAEVVASISDWTAPGIMSGVSRFAFSHRSSNLIVSNVPGPPIPLYLLGARMLECYPLVPLFANQTLGIALFSYAGGLYWGLNAERKLFPALGDFILALDEAFQELSDAVVPER